jgi:hypothetical protein
VLAPGTLPFTGWERNGRLQWGAEWFVGVDPCAKALTDFGFPRREGVSPPRFIAELPEAHGVDFLELKARLLAHPSDGRLCNPLCFLAPLLGNFAPAEALALLAPSSWPHVPEKPLHHVLNNALLHAAVGMANSHFERLPELLALPVARGGYTDLIPRQVLAVLRTKVAALSGA